MNEKSYNDETLEKKLSITTDSLENKTLKQKGLKYIIRANSSIIT